MRIRKTFQLKGKTCRVRYESKPMVEGHVCDGVCDFEQRTITLRKGLTRDAKSQTFLHELMHAIIFESHVARGTKFSEGVEEVICDATADMISSLFELSWKRMQN